MLREFLKEIGHVLMQPDGFLKAYSSFKNDIIHEMPGIGFLV